MARSGQHTAPRRFMTAKQRSQAGAAQTVPQTGAISPAHHRQLMSSFIPWRSARRSTRLSLLQAGAPLSSVVLTAACSALVTGTRLRQSTRARAIAVVHFSSICWERTGNTFWLGSSRGGQETRYVETCFIPVLTRGSQVISRGFSPMWRTQSCGRRTTYRLDRLVHRHRPPHRHPTRAASVQVPRIAA